MADCNKHPLSSRVCERGTKTCEVRHLKPCKCGGEPRYFGEALMGSITCGNKCGESVSTMIDKHDVRKLWNNGVRGWYEGR